VSERPKNLPAGKSEKALQCGKTVRSDGKKTIFGGKKNTGEEVDEGWSVEQDFFIYGRHKILASCAGLEGDQHDGRTRSKAGRAPGPGEREDPGSEDSRVVTLVMSGAVDDGVRRLGTVR